MMARRVLVVGGGISGLSAAHRVLERDPGADVQVLEGASHVGGLIRTERRDGFVVELGPDSIITDKPWALALAERVGLKDEVVKTLPQNRGAYVVSKGKLVRIPEGFSLIAPMRLRPFLKTPILSWRGKLRAAIEPVLPRGNAIDESLSSFVRRRFGHELFETLAQPLVSGIYGADPDVLSLRATMPRFLEMEERSRSVSLALRKRARDNNQSASGARYGLFASFRLGNQQLIDAVAAVLGDRIRTGSQVTSVQPRAFGYSVRLTDGSELEAEHVVLALSAWKAARLVEPVAPEVSEELSGIHYGSAATVTFAWARKEIPHALDAYGFVCPIAEGGDVLASTWSSRKWPNRAPEDSELIRVFMGGFGREHVLDMDEPTLVEAARRGLGKLLGVTAEPRFSIVQRYDRAAPHYHVGHLERVAAIDGLLEGYPGLHLAGNAYRGVGIPDSVRSGEAAADAIVDDAR